MLAAINQRVREYLGTHRIPRMEHAMSTMKQQLTDLSAKVDDLVADVRAALNDGSQGALDELRTKIDAFDAEVGDADGSDNPAEPAPVDPENPNNV